MDNSQQLLGEDQGYTVSFPDTLDAYTEAQERTLGKFLRERGLFANLKELSPEASELVRTVSTHGVTPEVRETFNNLRKKGEITYKALLSAFGHYLNSQK